MADCIFCQIIAGSAPASIVYRDDVCVAFMDIQPVNPGHLLVIPNRHASYMADLMEDEGAQMFRVAHRLVAALRRSGVKCEGVNLWLADGEAAMQEVYHVHLHVFPRYVGDGFGLKFPPAYWQKPERKELNTLAEQIKLALETE